MQATFDGLTEAQANIISTKTALYNTKTSLSNELAADIAQLEGDLKGLNAQLADDKAYLAELSTVCTDKEASTFSAHSQQVPLPRARTERIWKNCTARAVISVRVTEVGSGGRVQFFHEPRYSLNRRPNEKGKRDTQRPEQNKKKTTK